MSSTPFVEPADVEDARARQAALTASLQDVEAQLGDRNRTVDGVRMEGPEYFEWRNRALHAKISLEKQIRALKAWRRTHDAGADYGVLLETINRKQDEILELLATLIPGH